MTTPLLFDTSVYVSIFRNAAFAAAFQPRYLRDIPLTHFSSVVVQELLARAHTPPGNDDRLPLSTNPLSVSDVSSLQAILSGKR